MSAKKVVVIGAGPAGIEAAREAARGGAVVSIVTDAHPGGRATAASLLPSKAFLHAAELRAQRGEKALAKPAEIQAIVHDVDRLAAVETDRQKRILDDAGVRFVQGVARFVSAREIEVTREGKEPKRLPFDAAIVCAGSEPRFPPGLFGEAKGPDGQRIFAPRHLRTLRDVPKTLLVVGGGATGAEVVCAMQRFGVEVSWLLDELGVLPELDRDVADSLADVLFERGVKLVHQKKVLSVEPGPGGVLAKLDGGRTYGAERAFVAVGRRADVSRLDLAAAGLAPDERTGGLRIDAHGRTSVPGIWAAGDVLGEAAIASAAAAEGWTAARDALGLEVPPLDRRALVRAVYTSPEIATIGASAEEAATTGEPFRIRTASFAESLRGALEGVGFDRHQKGTLRVLVASETDAILGASAIGPRASEVLAPVGIAMRLGIPAQKLATVFLASPTLGELVPSALRG